MWKILHSLAFHYISLVSPNIPWPETLNVVMLNLGLVLPCSVCRSSYKGFYAEMNALDDWAHIFEWLFALHEKVNAKLHKPPRHYPSIHMEHRIYYEINPNKFRFTIEDLELFAVSLAFACDMCAAKSTSNPESALETQSRIKAACAVLGNIGAAIAELQAKSSDMHKVGSGLQKCFLSKTPPREGELLAAVYKCFSANIRLTYETAVLVGRALLTDQGSETNGNKPAKTNQVAPSTASTYTPGPKALSTLNEPEDSSSLVTSTS